MEARRAALWPARKTGRQRGRKGACFPPHGDKAKKGIRDICRHRMFQREKSEVPNWFGAQFSGRVLRPGAGTEDTAVIGCHAQSTCQEQDAILDVHIC